MAGLLWSTEAEPQGWFAGWFAPQPKPSIAEVVLDGALEVGEGAVESATVAGEVAVDAASEIGAAALDAAHVAADAVGATPAVAAAVAALAVDVAAVASIIAPLLALCTAVYFLARVCKRKQAATDTPVQIPNSLITSKTQHTKIRNCWQFEVKSRPRPLNRAPGERGGAGRRVYIWA